MACRHVNEKVLSLAPVIDELPEGFNITCEFAKTGNQQAGVMQAMEWGARGFLGVIGPASSLVAGPLSIVAAASGSMPVVSYWADSALLSDKQQYPNFARTIPASEMEAHATVSVMQELGWENFAFIYSLARSNWFQELSQAAARRGMNLVTAQKYELGASEEQTYASIEQAVSAVAGSGARIIIEAVDYSEFPHLVRAAEAHNLTGIGFQWLSPNRPQATTVLARGDSLGVREASVHAFLRGELTVALEPFGSPSAAERYHEVERTEDEEKLFAALLPGTQRFDLHTHTCLGVCGYMYDAVVAMAVAIARAEGKGGAEDHGLILAELAEVRFAGASGAVAFDANLDREASGVPFSVFTQTSAPGAREGRWELLSVPVGSWVLGHGLARFRDADFEWSGGQRGWHRMLQADLACGAGGQFFSEASLRCERCPPGTASPAAHLPCTPCPRGTHAPDAGSLRCRACGEEGYADGEGMAACKPCPAHHRGAAVVQAEGGVGAVSLAECKCLSSRLFQCAVGPYEMGVIACLVLVGVLGGLAVLALRRGRRVLDPEDEAVQKRAALLRGLLWIDRAHGFVCAGEWGSSSAIRLRSTHLESLARMTMLLDFDPAHIDSLAALFTYMDPRDASRTASSGSDASEGEWSASASAVRFSSGPTGRSKQYLALVQLLLDLCKHLLDPATSDAAEEPAELPAGWVHTIGSELSVSQRFQFLTDKVARLRVWEEHDNFLALKGLAQRLMDVQHDACDELFARLAQEEGGQELIAFAGAEDMGEWTGVVRQDDVKVQAIPIVDTLKDKVVAHRRATINSLGEEDVSGGLSLLQQCRDRNPTAENGRASLTLDRRLLSVTISVVESDGLEHDTVGVLLLENESLLQDWLDSPDTFQTFLHRRSNKNSITLTSSPEPGRLASRSVQWAPSSPPPGVPPPGVHRNEAEQTPASRLGNVGGWRSSRFRMPPGKESDFIKGMRGLHSALKAVARGAARKTLSNDSALGSLSDEEPFVQFLAGRAALLNKEFQAKVAGLPFGEVRPSLGKGAPSGPFVFKGPVKSKQRMLEKVLAYSAELEQTGALASSHPLAAQILDPVRCSIVCRNPRHVIKIAEWLISNGPAMGLPVVRVKNKFNMPPSHAGEYDGYRDIMLSVVFSSASGLKIIGEVQLHDERMYEIKVRMHRLYKLKRAASAKTIF